MSVAVSLWHVSVHHILLFSRYHVPSPSQSANLYIASDSAVHIAHVHIIIIC